MRHDKWFPHHFDCRNVPPKPPFICQLLVERAFAGKRTVPFLYNIYTNDQPTRQETRQFVYADDSASSPRKYSLHEVERKVTNALNAFLLLLRRYLVFENRDFKSCSPQYVSISPDSLSPTTSIISFDPIQQKLKCLASAFATERQRDRWIKCGVASN